MADATEIKTTAIDLDEEGKRLQLEAEKAKYREAIAKSKDSAAEAKSSRLQGFSSGIETASTGTVTVGAQAGAFGPWLAHQSLEAAADKNGAAVSEKLKTLPKGVAVCLSSIVATCWAER